MRCASFVPHCALSVLRVCQCDVCVALRIINFARENTFTLICALRCSICVVRSTRCSKRYARCVAHNALLDSCFLFYCTRALRHANFPRCVKLVLFALICFCFVARVAFCHLQFVFAFS